MMLGKRQRQATKRTTSLSEIKFELNSPEPSDHQIQIRRQLLTVDENRQIHQADHNSSTHAGDFLRSCFLCKRFLVPGRDIYMYRGDRAFCSLECRQRQITLDERKEKASVRSIVVVPSRSAIG